MPPAPDKSQDSHTYDINMNIQAILNPSAEDVRPRRLPIRTQLPTTQQVVLPTTKHAKDQPVYKLGAVKGPENYPPYNSEPGSRLYDEHVSHHVFPLGNLGSYPATIPYSSDKKKFREFTGRNGFDGMTFAFTLRLASIADDSQFMCTNFNSLPTPKPQPKSTSSTGIT